MSAAAPPSTAFDLSSSYGPFFVVSFLSATLWGATCTQTFTYFIGYPRDRLWLKCMVVWLWLMDTTHQALVTQAMYSLFVSRFGDVAGLAFIPLGLIVEILFTVIVSSITQLFFTYRIWIFSGRKWIFPLVAIPLVVSQFVLQSIYMAGLLGNNTLPQVKRENPIGIAYNTIAAVTDVALSCCMVYLLRAERSGFEGLDQTIGRLIIFSLNSGLWTALVTVATIITLLTIPMPNFVFAAIYTILCPLYCNTVLANLNSRSFLRRLHPNASTSVSHSGNVALEPLPRQGAGRVPQKNLISIQVDTTTATVGDSLDEIENDLKGSQITFA